jgi:serine/threonine protein kinase
LFKKKKIKTHWCLFSQPQFLRCYGITQLQNGEFAMVMQFASFGDLRLHLQRNRISSWKDKIRILKQIARGLAEMHKRGLIHGDLHSGNVMNIDRLHFVIGDVGLCGPANRLTRRKGVYGVLPYVAPELLKGAEYSKKADIYSFAIIMWEICSGIRPYAGTAHDMNMARDICEGKRPPVPPGTPSFYSELMKSCWDANPRNRPDASEVLKTVYHWLVNDSLDDFLRKGGSTITFNNMSNNHLTHPEAIYHSRLLEFSELREHKNQALSINMSSRGPEHTLNNSLVQENFTQETLNKSSQETLEPKVPQNKNNNSKQSHDTSNKSQDTSNSRSVSAKSPQRTNGYLKTPQQRIYNSSSPKLSQNSSYDLKQSQREPPRSESFVKSEDSVSINSKSLENPLSVFIPDDDIATLTSFWSMDSLNPDKANTFAS